MNAVEYSTLKSGRLLKRVNFTSGIVMWSWALERGGATNVDVAEACSGVTIDLHKGIHFWN